MEILKIENLTFTYPLAQEPTLCGINFSVEAGEFIAVTGATGSGKSTLLRLLKRELAPLGKREGKIFFRGTPTDELSPEQTAFKVGYVMQNPEQQIVTDKVWHELAFALESMGIPQSAIAHRIAEMASYFGIEEQYDSKTCELSGGQKQILNLAAVMVTSPDIIILDEPTAQLDPIAASSFIATLKKLNSDLGLTVIIAEHRLEEIIPICDRIIALENGKLTVDGEPQKALPVLLKSQALSNAMPAASRLYHLLSANGTLPVTVRDGRRFIEKGYSSKIRALPNTPSTRSEKSALKLDDVYFRYGKDKPDVLHGLNLDVYENEIFCILGGNGSGKTTALRVSAGLIKPYSGSVSVFGKKLKEYRNGSLYTGCLTVLPQDVQTVFLKNTVREELEDAHADCKALPFDLSALYGKHPYDLSGGEQQLVALAKALAAKPRLLLMDEPTKGLDAYKKQQLTEIICQLRKDGVTVVTVTHDVEFAASCADRIALFFRGGITSCASPKEFFSQTDFYATAASRMSKGYYDGAVTVEQLAELCRLNGERDNEGN